MRVTIEKLISTKSTECNLVSMTNSKIRNQKSIKAVNRWLIKTTQIVVEARMQKTCCYGHRIMLNIESGGNKRSL